MIFAAGHNHTMSTLLRRSLTSSSTRICSSLFSTNLHHHHRVVINPSPPLLVFPSSSSNASLLPFFRCFSHRSTPREPSLRTPTSHLVNNDHEEDKKPTVADSDLARLNLLKKVYGIVAIQAVTVAGVSTYTSGFAHSLSPTDLAHLGQSLKGPYVITTIGSLALSRLWKQYPFNVIWLGLFTVAQSVVIGFGCSRFETIGLLYSVYVVAASVCSLTFYPFWAVKSGFSFRFCDAMIFPCLTNLAGCCLLGISYLAGLTHLYAVVNVVLWAMYVLCIIVGGSQGLIKQASLDENVISASMAIYSNMLFGCLKRRRKRCC